MDEVNFKTQKVLDNHRMVATKGSMKNELLSASQISRLADVPVGQIFQLVNAGKLSPVAVNRSGKMKNLFFNPSQADEVRQLVALELHPAC